jgi:predicted lipoprotein with Yx(FWY)xxD motif
MRTRLVPRALLLVVLAAAGVGTALAVSGPILKASHNAKLGAIVVDAQGRTLYHLTSEHGKVACRGACTTYWPPVLWPGKGKPALGPGLKAAKLGTIRRSNGTLQVTYNKFPLYRYYLDKKPGEALGEGLDDSPGAWYAVSTSGEIVKPAAGASPGPTTTGDNTTTGMTTTGDTTTTDPGGYTYSPKG